MGRGYAGKGDKVFNFSPEADRILLLPHGHRGNVPTGSWVLNSFVHLFIYLSTHPSIHLSYTCPTWVVFEWYGVVKCLAEKFGINPRVSKEPLKIPGWGSGQMQEVIQGKCSSIKIDLRSKIQMWSFHTSHRWVWMHFCSGGYTEPGSGPDWKEVRQK